MRAGVVSELYRDIRDGAIRVLQLFRSPLHLAATDCLVWSLPQLLTESAVEVLLRHPQFIRQHGCVEGRLNTGLDKPERLSDQAYLSSLITRPSMRLVRKHAYYRVGEKMPRPCRYLHGELRDGFVGEQLLNLRLRRIKIENKTDTVIQGASDTDGVAKGHVKETPGALCVLRVIVCDTLIRYVAAKASSLRQVVAPAVDLKHTSPSQRILKNYTISLADTGAPDMVVTR